jgi:hypothetical protein
MDDDRVVTYGPTVMADPSEIVVYGPRVVLSREWLDEVRTFEQTLRRAVAPWTVADGWRGWPDTIILDDGIDIAERALVRLVDRLAGALRRVTDAWSVLTGAASLDDGDEGD